MLRLASFNASCTKFWTAPAQLGVDPQRRLHSLQVGAQIDAVNMLFDVKTNSNPENVVGLMTMAGKSPEVLVTLTQDVGKILTALHSSKIAGTSNLGTVINIAQLALKHRQNKNQRQRIIAFVGSPLENESDLDLIKLGKKLKKNNVAVDIINFGEDETNEDKLETKPGKASTSTKSPESSESTKHRWVTSRIPMIYVGVIND
ncbi:unnamed protein product [Tilletia caries]|uniref:VWFA domain-containing protein n=1 Tax=Tilletia caries TaxID=13290 RepID=A0ABN7ILE6_9BASI|nr:unnamed protein product [Tilletia caries]